MKRVIELACIFLLSATPALATADNSREQWAEETLVATVAL
jgi:hypothetical protein